MRHRSRREFLVTTGSLAGGALVAARSFAFGSQAGARAGAPDAYATPKPMIAGPFEPTWESLRDNWRVPTWFNDAKFGIFIHWGL